MRWALLVLLLPVLSGCTEVGDGDAVPSDGQGGADVADGEQLRQGVVLLSQLYRVTYPRQSGYNITFTGEERNVVLEIQQDSGVLANLHVAIGGCGDVDPAASASWESYPICDRANPTSTQVTIDVKPGSPGLTGSGRFIVRADVP